MNDRVFFVINVRKVFNSHVNLLDILKVSTKRKDLHATCAVNRTLVVLLKTTTKLSTVERDLFVTNVNDYFSKEMYSRNIR